jgi:hypothetical protein
VPAINSTLTPAERCQTSGTALNTDSYREIICNYPKPYQSFWKFHSCHTDRDNYNRMFNRDCDSVNKRFDEEFGEVNPLKPE